MSSKYDDIFNSMFIAVSTNNSALVSDLRDGTMLVLRAFPSLASFKFSVTTFDLKKVVPFEINKIGVSDLLFTLMQDNDIQICWEDLKQRIINVDDNGMIKQSFSIDTDYIKLVSRHNYTYLEFMNSTTENCALCLRYDDKRHELNVNGKSVRISEQYWGMLMDFVYADGVYLLEFKKINIFDTKTRVVISLDELVYLFEGEMFVKNDWIHKSKLVPNTVLLWG